jgi:diguanylate cyclase (GGDEF)-like protein
MHDLDLTRAGGPPEPALRVALSVARRIGGSVRVREVADALRDAGQALTGFDAASMWLVDADDAEPVAVDSDDDPGPALLEALVSGDPAAVADVNGGWTELVVPMKAGPRVVGALALAGGARALDPAALDALQVVALHAGTVVDAMLVMRRAEQVAGLDPVTRLRGRRQLEADLEDECERSRRYERPLGLIAFGLDGDADVARAMADAVAGAVRTSDRVYRSGAGFVVVVPEGTVRSTRELADRIRSTLAECDLTTSLGVAVVPADGTTGDELLAAADEALTEAKAAGRNCVAVSGAGIVTGEGVLQLPA